MPLGLFEAWEGGWTVIKVAGECDRGHKMQPRRNLLMCKKKAALGGGLLIWGAISAVYGNI